MRLLPFCATANAGRACGKVVEAPRADGGLASAVAFLEGGEPERSIGRVGSEQGGESCQNGTF